MFVAGLAQITLMLILSLCAGPSLEESLQKIESDSSFRLFSFEFYLVFIVAILYHWVGVAYGGVSPGKLICRLRVVSEDFSPCNSKKAIARELLFFVDSLFFGLVAYLLMKESLLRQRLGDKLGHTTVLKARDVPEKSKATKGKVALTLTFSSLCLFFCCVVGYVLKLIC